MRKIKKERKEMNEQNISFSIKNVNAPCIIGTQKAAILTIENECICIEKKKAEKSYSK